MYPSCVESHLKMRLIRIISRCEHAADLVRYVLVVLTWQLVEFLVEHGLALSPTKQSLIEPSWKTHEVSWKPVI